MSGAVPLLLHAVDGENITLYLHFCSNKALNKKRMLTEIVGANL